MSNVDGTHIAKLLKICLEETLFLLRLYYSETMTNAITAKEAVLKAFNGDESSIAKHFVALSTNAKARFDFGIDTANMFDSGTGLVVVTLYGLLLVYQSLSVLVLIITTLFIKALSKWTNISKPLLWTKTSL